MEEVEQGRVRHLGLALGRNKASLMAVRGWPA